VRTLIEKAWSDAQRQANVQLFDGPLCRLERISADGPALNLRLSRTSYKMFLGTNLHNVSLADQYGADSLANPVGLSCALFSSDGQLLFGQRNDRVAYYPGRIHPFAGALEPAERVDVFEEARRELAEELHLNADDIAEMRCIGMVEDLSLRQPELVFSVRSRLTRAQIEQRVDATEHAAIFAIPANRDAARAFVDDPRLTPVAVGTIMLCW
jgi:8-oxo-dGTP pyrophosphatase MutT (NUDIX family)